MVYGDAGQLEGISFVEGRSGLLLEHPLLERVEEDLAGAGEVLRRGAVDERLVLGHADVDLVQLELVERALAALDHGRRTDLLPDHSLDPLQAVEIEIRLDPCKLKENVVVIIFAMVCVHATQILVVCN